MPDLAEQPEYLTIPKAMRRTGLSRRQFDMAIEEGSIPLYDIGAWPRLRWADVIEWIESTRREA